MIKHRDTKLDYAQLIKKWHTKANDEDYFSKFVFEYLAFIAYLKTKKYPSLDPRKSVTDRQAIQNFKRENEIRNDYIALIDESPVLTIAWLQLKNELDRSPLGNVTRNTEIAEE